jgi:hypothetical protein
MTDQCSSCFAASAQSEYAKRPHEAPRAALYTPYVWFQSVLIFLYKERKDNSLSDLQADQGSKCQLAVVLVGVYATHVFEAPPCCFGTIPDGIITPIHW